MDDFETTLNNAYLVPAGEADELVADVMETIAHSDARHGVIVAGAGFVGLAAAAAMISAARVLAPLSEAIARWRMELSGVEYSQIANDLTTPTVLILIGVVLLAAAGVRLLLREI
jgi:hypothetical protein